MYRTQGPAPIDLSIIDPQNNQTLLYSNTSNHWENKFIDYEVIENTPTIPPDISDENYVVIGDVPASLANARKLEVSSPITLTDEGAGSSVSLALNKQIPDDISDEKYVVLGSVPSSIPNARRLVAGSNITLTDEGAGNTLTVSASSTEPFSGKTAKGFRARFYDNDVIVNGSPELIKPWLSSDTAGSNFLGDHNYNNEFDPETGVYTVPEDGFYNISYSLLFKIDSGADDVQMIVIRTKILWSDGTTKRILKHVQHVSGAGLVSINEYYGGVAINAGAEIYLTARVHGNDSVTLLAYDDDGEETHTEYSVSTFSVMPQTYW